MMYVQQQYYITQIVVFMKFLFCFLPGGGAHRDYADVILEGFQLMCTQQKPQMVYPPPPLPRQFKPFHVFTTEETAAITAAQQIPKVYIHEKQCKIYHKMEPGFY